MEVFFLGTGTIETKSNYIAFIKKSNGGYTKYFMPEDSTIYMGDFKPRHEYNECKLTAKIALDRSTYCDKQYNNIYLPGGSIVQSFKVN